MFIRLHVVASDPDINLVSFQVTSAHIHKTGRLFKSQKTGWKINTAIYPGINSHAKKLYIQGRDKSKDNLVIDTSVRTFEILKQTINEFNAKFHGPDFQHQVQITDKYIQLRISNSLTNIHFTSPKTGWSLGLDNCKTICDPHARKLLVIEGTSEIKFTQTMKNMEAFTDIMIMLDEFEEIKIIPRIDFNIMDVGQECITFSADWKNPQTNNIYQSDRTGWTLINDNHGYGILPKEKQLMIKDNGTYTCTLEAYKEILLTVIEYNERYK